MQARKNFTANKKFGLDAPVIVLVLGTSSYYHKRRDFDSGALF